MQFILGDLTFPLTPEKVTVSEGAHAQSLSVLDLGTISFPRGNEPTKISFSGILPGSGNAALSIVTDWQEPGAIVETISTAKSKGTVQRFQVTFTRIFFSAVYVESLSWSHSGGMGDIAFDLTMIERRPLTIGTLGAAPPLGQATGQPQPAPNVPVTYTAVAGDTLTSLAKLFYHDTAKAGTIYLANKSVIVPDDQASIVGLTLVIP